MTDISRPADWSDPMVRKAIRDAQEAMHLESLTTSQLVDEILRTDDLNEAGVLMLEACIRLDPLWTRRCSPEPADDWEKEQYIRDVRNFHRHVEKMKASLKEFATEAPARECICPTCGIRHGGSNVDGGF